ncbi:MAG: beta-N-acetylhexosaminidase [Planctomycetota bacterium]
MNLSLLPWPQQIEHAPGRFELTPETQIYCAGQDANLQYVQQQLRQELQQRFSLPFSEGPPTATVRLLLQEGQEPEAYQLQVHPHGITIQASSCAGLFYGVQTLLQLSDDAPSGIPSVSIQDRPRYRWRGMHLDVSRHFFPVSFVKRIINLLALHKLNVFHWHLTDDQGWRIAIEKYPRLSEVAAWRQADGGRYGGFYTQSDIREVMHYAEQRFVTVVPEIEMPGHSLAALAAYPELSCSGGPFQVATTWGIFDDVYCAGTHATFQFLEDVLNEVMGLFPGRFIHIGGDECPKKRWRSCRRCQARLQQEGLQNENQLQGWFTRRISRFLSQHGRQAIGWDEVLEGNPDPSCAVMSWRGKKGGRDAARRGHEVVICPTSHCYFDYRQSDEPGEPGAHGTTPLETVYQFEPTPRSLNVSERQKVLGAQGNVWTEQMPSEEQVEFMAFPRLCALAEALWTDPEKRDWSEFEERLSTHLKRLDQLGVRYRPR